MSSTPLVIRADAGPAIGVGHVMRCLALAQQCLDQGSRVFLVGRVDSSILQERLLSDGVEIIPMDADQGTADDLAFTLAAIKETGADWLVLDGYEFGAEYQRAVRRAGTRLLMLDDYGHQPEYETDILLNQNLGAENMAYRLNADSLRLDGPRYALLRREFVSAARGCPSRRTPDKARRVLVILGGSDPRNLSLAVLQALADTGRDDWSVTVAVGPANLHRAELEAEARQLAFEVRVLALGRETPDIMAASDMAVTAAGSTCWELVLLGVPSLVMACADNQAGIASALAQAGAARSLGRVKQVDRQILSQEITTLADDSIARQVISRTAQFLVDGGGAERVYRAMFGEAA